MEFVPKVCLLFVSIWLISVLCLIISCHLLLLAISASFGSRVYRWCVKLLVYDLSTFFLEALTATSFSHSTAFIVSHKFGYNVPSFSLNSKKSLILYFFLDQVIICTLPPALSRLIRLCLPQLPSPPGVGSSDHVEVSFLPHPQYSCINRTAC